MTILEIILIGVALAMDALALTISNCTTYKGQLNKKQEISMPILFSVFQFLMPVIGFYIGSIFVKFLNEISGYLTFAIFFVLALKIVIDNLKEIKENKLQAQDVLQSSNASFDNSQNVGGFSKNKKTRMEKVQFSYPIVILQAIATSIDALIIGVTFTTSLSFSIFLAGLIIGVVTLILVFGGLLIGKSLSELFGKYACWIGAIILFALAVKNLIPTF